MVVPQHIYKKADMENLLIEKANNLKSEIEQWAISNGADVDSQEWKKLVIDDSKSIGGINTKGIIEYFDRDKK
jgi:hypothetical protein